MSVRMRHTRAHTKNRRSHHRLKEPRLSICPECRASHLRHRVCESCGRYRGRIVIDVAQKQIKKEKKAKQRQERATQEKQEVKEDSEIAEDQSDKDQADLVKPLNAEELSKR